MITPYYPEFVTSVNTGDEYDGRDFSSFVRIFRDGIWYRVHMFLTIQRSCPEMDKVLRSFMEHAHQITHLFSVNEYTSAWWEEDPCQLSESQRLIEVEKLKQEYGNNWNKWKNR